MPPWLGQGWKCLQRLTPFSLCSRKADLDQSDGEEDFYYTELDVNVDSLTDGLSSLTPVSPTSSVPPAFPVLEVQRTPPVLVKPEDSVESPLSHSAPTSLCHVHTDHAYQVGHVEKQVRPHWWGRRTQMVE